MGKAIGMVELASIARGIETCDYMVKAAQVSLMRSSTVCPGKYIILVGGETAAVREALEVGLSQGGEFVVDSLLIPNAHEQLFPAISGIAEVVDAQAVGVMEFYSITSALLAADCAAKTAQITLIEVRAGYAVGGKGFVVLTGDVEAVKAALEAAVNESELYVASAVIPRPAPELLQALL